MRACTPSGPSTTRTVSSSLCGLASVVVLIAQLMRATVGMLRRQDSSAAADATRKNHTSLCARRDQVETDAPLLEQKARSVPPVWGQPQPAAYSLLNASA